jgi:hypothetical protein
MMAAVRALCGSRLTERSKTPRVALTICDQSRHYKYRNYVYPARHRLFLQLARLPSGARERLAASSFTSNA